MIQALAVLLTLICAIVFFFGSVYINISFLIDAITIKQYY